MGGSIFPRSKVIRDSIHGDIFLSELEFDLIDTPEVQRLRRIKQLGMTYLVYPSANHTRFEHSLGALHLAGRIADRLGLSEEEKIEVRIAALLHDVGHGPLSHTSEELLARYLREPHEKIGREIIENSSISDVLRSAGIDPSGIGDIISGGRGYLGKIVCSAFDVDRMDYLVRDAHHTGVAYGIIDLDRIVNTMEIHNDSLVISERGLRAVEALLVARFLMIPTVYLHHASRIADVMFLRATERAIEEGLDYKQLYKMDDYDIQNLFRSSEGYIRDIGRRIDERRLFKKAYVRGWNELSEDFREKLLSLREDVKRWREVENTIAGDCGLGPGYVLLDIPPLPEYSEMDAEIFKEGKISRLEEESPLVKILMEGQKVQWNIGVYSPKEKLGEVMKACEKLEEYI
jgi:hypothetical protein